MPDDNLFPHEIMITQQPLQLIQLQPVEVAPAHQDPLDVMMKRDFLDREREPSFESARLHRSSLLEDVMPPPTAQPEDLATLKYNSLEMEQQDQGMLPPPMTSATPQYKIKPPRIPMTDIEAAEECKEAVAGGPEGAANERRQGRQNQLLSTIPQCPVFEPTLEEFTRYSFQEYLELCEELIDEHCGVFKVRLFSRDSP